MGDGAQAGALLAAEVGVERLDGGVDAGVGLGAGGLDRDHRLLPGGDLGADGVLLDHLEVDLGGVLGGADEGGDGGEAGLVGGRSRRGRGRRRGGGSRRSGRSGAGSAARRGRARRGRPRSACAGRRAAIERRSSVSAAVVEVGAVAVEGGLVDLGEGDEVDVGHRGSPGRGGGSIGADAGVLRGGAGSGGRRWAQRRLHSCRCVSTGSACLPPGRRFAPAPGRRCRWLLGGRGGRGRRPGGQAAVGAARSQRPRTV